MTAWILHEKYTAGDIGSFYKEKDFVDVLFCGPSLMNNGVSPYDLWDEQGIALWNIAVGGQPLLSTYYTIKQALNYQPPKVIVVDVLNNTVCQSWGLLGIIQLIGFHGI